MYNARMMQVFYLSWYSLLKNWLNGNYIKGSSLTVSGLFSDCISFLGNTSDVIQLVLLHIALQKRNHNIKEKQKQIKHEVSTESKGINFCCDTNEIKQSTLTRNCGLKEYCSLIICLHSYISLCVKLEVLNVLLNCEKNAFYRKKPTLMTCFSTVWFSSSEDFHVLHGNVSLQYK